MSLRWGTTFTWLLISIGLTVGLTALLWLLFDAAAFFGLLFLPFLYGMGPHRRGRAGDEVPPVVRTCPRCGYGSADPEIRYCPRDGSALV